MSGTKLPRVLFFGSGDFAVPSLRALAQSPYPLIGVVSQPPKPAGRGLKLLPTPVHQAAEEAGLTVWTPVRCRAPEFLEQVEALKPDLIALAAYGQILPERLLRIAPMGNWNVHASLLPRWRGASPIQYALLHGDTVSGVTIMEMVRELDAGDIYLQAELSIMPEDNYDALEAKLGQLGAETLIRALSLWEQGALTRQPQDASQATFAPLIQKEELWVRWEETAVQNWNRVRAFSPRWGAATQWQGKRIKLFQCQPEPENQGKDPGKVLEASAAGIVVSCGQGALRLLELQMEGKSRMRAQDFLNGVRIQPGDYFTSRQ
ncbi:MAG: methionyl-tRNA formyltransferase [Fimbriimonadia bacterium]|nr:methionyl-tRNA formyltransferase [Fimbriimonadia bacterium]